MNKQQNNVTNPLSPRTKSLKNFDVNMDLLLKKDDLGIFYEAVQHHSHKKYSIKIIPQSTVFKSQTQLSHQLEVLKLLKECEFVHQFIKAFSSQNNVYLLMEHFEMDLKTYHEKKNKLSEQIVFGIIRGIVQALVEFQKIGAVHRFVNPSSIFMKGNNARLAQLQFTALKNCHPVASPHKLFYESPELLRDKTKYSHKSDIWSLGITSLSLLLQSKRFFGTEDPEIIQFLASDSFNLKIPVSSPMMAFLKACLQKDPNRRPAASELLKKIEDKIVSDMELGLQSNKKIALESNKGLGLESFKKVQSEDTSRKNIKEIKHSDKASLHDITQENMTHQFKMSEKTRKRIFHPLQPKKHRRLSQKLPQLGEEYMKKGGDGVKEYIYEKKTSEDISFFEYSDLIFVLNEPAPYSEKSCFKKLHKLVCLLGMKYKHIKREEIPNYLFAFQSRDEYFNQVIKDLPRTHEKDFKHYFKVLLHECLMVIVDYCQKDKHIFQKFQQNDLPLQQLSCLHQAYSKLASSCVNKKFLSKKAINLAIFTQITEHISE